MGDARATFGRQEICMHSFRHMFVFRGSSGDVPFVEGTIGTPPDCSAPVAVIPAGSP